MFDMAKQKRKSIILAIIFLVFFVIFLYININLTFPTYELVVGVENSDALFPNLEQGLVIFISILLSLIFLLPDIIFLIMGISNIFNFFKYSKLEREHRK